MGPFVGIDILLELQELNVVMGGEEHQINFYPEDWLVGYR